MCDFCHKRGEGKTSSRQAKSYAKDLIGDLDRQEAIGRFSSDWTGRGPSLVAMS